MRISDFTGFDDAFANFFLYIFHESCVSQLGVEEAGAMQAMERVRLS